MIHFLLATKWYQTLHGNGIGQNGIDREFLVHDHAHYAVQPKMFDGVAVGMALWPEMFETQKAYVYVDDEGFTKMDENREPKCTIGIKIQDTEFLKRMYRKLVEQNLTRN